MKETKESNESFWTTFGVGIITGCAAGYAFFYLYNKSEEAERREDELKKVIKEKNEVIKQEIETNKKLSEKLFVIASKEVNITNNNTNTFLPVNNLQQTTTINPVIVQEETKKEKNTSQKWKILGHAWDFLKFWLIFLKR